MLSFEEKSNEEFFSVKVVLPEGKSSKELFLFSLKTLNTGEIVKMYILFSSIWSTILFLSYPGAKVSPGPRPQSQRMWQLGGA